MRAISRLIPKEFLPRHAGILAALMLLAVLAACGGGQAESFDLASPAHASPNMGALDSVTGSDAIAPIPPAPGTLRQVYVLPSSPAANDANDGSFATPLLTIGQAMRNLRLGDDVVIGPGVYRETVEVPPMTPGRDTYIRAMTRYASTIKGSDLVGGWSSSGGDVWVRNWAESEPEQVFRGGAPLKQIAGTVFNGFPTDPANPLKGLYDPATIWPGRIAGDQTSMLPDSFHYSAADKRLYVRLSKALTPGEQLEVSRRTYVLRALQAADLVIDGFIFEHANTSLTQRHGAVYLAGQRTTLRNSAIRNMDAFCVMLAGDDFKLLGTNISNCGQVGIGASGQRITITGNVLSGNNSRGFNLNWESGSMKFTGGTPGLTDSTISFNTVTNTNGDAIWLDWTPRNVLIEGNTLAYNVGHGIHFEAAHGATIRNNIAYGNGKRGIYVLEATDVAIGRNIAFANTYQGIAIAAGTRYMTNPDLTPLRNSVYGNTVAWNDARGNRLQFMLPGLAFANTSDRNVSHATDVVPRYAQDWPSPTNPYFSGLPAWRAYSGQDANSIESWGPMPSSLSTALAARKLLMAADLPPLLQTAGVP